MIKKAIINLIFFGQNGLRDFFETQGDKGLPLYEQFLLSEEVCRTLERLHFPQALRRKARAVADILEGDLAFKRYQADCVVHLESRRSRRREAEDCQLLLTGDLSS
ncbi:MAG: hypothetical protein J5966_07140 [Lachnospiraceae bacterium]|nr:hypothetical protein [Lachnospiraceae bacterium]